MEQRLDNTIFERYMASQQSTKPRENPYQCVYFLETKNILWKSSTTHFKQINILSVCTSISVCEMF